MYANHWTDNHVQTADFCRNSKASQAHTRCWPPGISTVTLVKPFKTTFNLKRLSSWIIFDSLQTQGCQAADRCPFYTLCHFMPSMTFSPSARQSASLGLCCQKLGSFSDIWGTLSQSQRTIFFFFSTTRKQSLHILTSLVQLHCPHFTRHLALWQIFTEFKAAQTLYDQRSPYTEVEDGQRYTKSKWKIQSMCFNCSNSADCLQNNRRVSTYS